MTFSSILWQTSTTGDGAAAGYTQAQTIRMFSNLLLNDMTDEGVLKNYANQLAETVNHGAAPTIDIDTGGAWIKGFPAWSEASENLAVTIPLVGDTGFRVVARASGGVTRTFRLAVLMNTDGVSALPALTQDATFPSGAGTLWEIPLYSGVVDTSGDMWETAAKLVAGVTDDKIFCHPNIEVETAMIANRTRKFFVPVQHAYNTTDVANIIAGAGYYGDGYAFPDAKLCTAYANFFCPQDFASSMTVKAIVASQSSGNVYDNFSASYAACGETKGLHSDTRGLTADAITLNLVSCISELALASVAIGDYIGLVWVRDATNISDTVTDEVGFLGFLVEYTADS